MKFAASAIALVAALMIVAFQPVEARTRISAWQGQFVDNVAARQAAALCGYTPTESEMDPGPLGGKSSPKKKQQQLLTVLAPGIKKAVAHRCPGSLLEADGPVKGSAVQTEPEMIPTPTETYLSSVSEAVYEAAEAVAEAKVEEAQRMAETYQATSSVPEAVYEAAEAVAEAKVEEAQRMAEEAQPVTVEVSAPASNGSSTFSLVIMLVIGAAIGYFATPYLNKAGGSGYNLPR